MTIISPHAICSTVPCNSCLKDHIAALEQELKEAKDKALGWERTAHDAAKGYDELKQDHDRLEERLHKLNLEGGMALSKCQQENARLELLVSGDGIVQERDRLREALEKILEPAPYRGLLVKRSEDMKTAREALAAELCEHGRDGICSRCPRPEESVADRSPGR